MRALFNKISKKTISALLAICMLAGLGIVHAGAQAAQPEIEIIFVNATGAPITPFASQHLSSWSPSLTRTLYGASLTFNGFYTGSVTIELHNSSGRIAWFTESFTNKAGVSYTRSRSTAAGTYKIVIKLTISSTTTERESSWMLI